MVRVADHLAAELHQPTVGERGLLDPAADPVACLQHGHVGPATREVARRGQAGEPGADDQDVRHWTSVTTCSGDQPMSTRSPCSQRSS